MLRFIPPQQKELIVDISQGLPELSCIIEGHELTLFYSKFNNLKNFSTTPIYLIIFFV